MKKLLREPLLHFAILGVAIFGFFAWRERSRPAESETPRIEVHAGTVAWLSEGFRKQWHREPDTREMEGMVEDYVREEVLYREALTLGLDRNDTIVRRRLAQKMEFLTQDIVTSATPGEAALRAYYEKNVLRYSNGARWSFRHVYFSRERHGEKIQAVVQEGLAALTMGASPDNVGDPFLRELDFSDATEGDISSALGVAFAAALARQPEGTWSGPVESTYGLHLVKVSGHKQGSPSPFEAVKDAVARDHAEEARRTANQELVSKLKQRYKISVDESAFSGTKAPPLKTANR